MAPSRSALDLLWDARWSARIGADSIYSSAPSFGPSDCFKIRTEASIFVRASLIQRVWSIMGFKSVFKGSDKRDECIPATSGHGDLGSDHHWHRGVPLSSLVPLSAAGDRRKSLTSTMAAVQALELDFL